MNSDPRMQMKQWQQAIVTRAESFWRWWRGELAALVPDRWSGQSKRRERVLHYTAGSFEVGDSGHTLRIPLDKAGDDPVLATWRTLDAGKDGVLVTLGDGDVLHKVLSLPAATEARLESVLGFELDRHTPFNAEQAGYGYRVLKHDRAGQRIDVELFVLPNAVLERIQEALNKAGLRPGAILPARVLKDARARSSLNLLPQGQRAPAKRTAVLSSRPVLVVLMLSLAIGVLFYRREARLVELQQQVGPREAVAQQAQAIRAEIELLESGGRYIYERRTARPSMLVLLDELTTILPDNTWLSRLELEGDQLNIQGESTGASGLIGLLEQSPLLDQVSFTSPVTINPRSQQERFSLTARIEGGGTP